MIAKDRYRNRRAMAWLSFGIITLVTCVLLGVGLLSDDLAQRVNSMSILSAGLQGLLSTIVLAYFGSTTFDDAQERRAGHGVGVTPGGNPSPSSEPLQSAAGG